MSTVRPPKVSVAIPVYNGEAHLAETIDSVLTQSWGDFELIICDDHSTDGSLDVVASRADNRIRILRNDRNLGFGENWNRCLAAAQGRYIKILPQDDLLQPNCLSKQAEVLEGDAAAEVALVFCARTIVGPSGRSHLTRRIAGKTESYTGAGIAKLTARMGTNPIGEPGAVLFRRTAALATGPFNGARPFVIDIDYWLRLLKHGRAVYLPEVLASFRVSRGSQSVRMAKHQASEFRAFLTELKDSGLYPLSNADVRMGGLAATLNGFGRAIIYRLTMGAAS
jgi:glycosyltransferase involved in cell wall biosynthesis